MVSYGCSRQLGCMTRCHALPTASNHSSSGCAKDTRSYVPCAFLEGGSAVQRSSSVRFSGDARLSSSCRAASLTCWPPVERKRAPTLAQMLSHAPASTGSRHAAGMMCWNSAMRSTLPGTFLIGRSAGCSPACLQYADVGQHAQPWTRYVAMYQCRPPLAPAALPASAGASTSPLSLRSSPLGPTTQTDWPWLISVGGGRQRALWPLFQAAFWHALRCTLRRHHVCKRVLCGSASSHHEPLLRWLSCEQGTRHQAKQQPCRRPTAGRRRKLAGSSSSDFQASVRVTSCFAQQMQKRGRTRRSS